MKKHDKHLAYRVFCLSLIKSQTLFIKNIANKMKILFFLNHNVMMTMYESVHDFSNKKGEIK